MHTCMHPGSISIDFRADANSSSSWRRRAVRRQNEIEQINKMCTLNCVHNRCASPKWTICPTSPSPPPAPPSTGTFSFVFANPSRLSSSAAAAAVAPPDMYCTLHHAAQLTINARSLSFGCHRCHRSPADRMGNTVTTAPPPPIIITPIISRTHVRARIYDTVACTVLHALMH
jgi:hypothetical protein